MESSQTSLAVLIKTTCLHIECQISWRSLGILTLILLDAKKNTKQSLIAYFMIAIEFITCYKVSNHGIWLQNFVMGLSIADGNNKSLVLYSNNNMSYTK